MKKPLHIPILFIFFVLSFPSWARADDMWSKFGRGVSNTFGGYFEIPYQMGVLGRTQRWPFAFFGGALKGLFYGTARTVTGVYEVATFLIPLPAGYQTIMRPEFPIPALDKDGGYG